MIRLIGLELEKIFRLKRTYVVFALVVIFLGLMLWGVSEARFRTLERIASRWHLDPQDYINGFFFVRVSLQPVCLFLLPLFVALLAGYEFAGEAAGGTLRFLCIRPVKRRQIFFAKFFAILGFTFLLTFILIMLYLGAGLWFFGSGELIINGRGFFAISTPYTISASEAFIRLMWAVPVITLAAFAMATFAMCLSVFTDSPATAIVTAISTYFICHILGQFPFEIFQTIKPYLLTTAMNYWGDLFLESPPVKVLARDAILLFCYIISFMLIGLHRFRHKDILS
jgi:ABC-2 type transport system permease protein